MFCWPIKRSCNKSCYQNGWDHQMLAPASLASWLTGDHRMRLIKTAVLMTVMSPSTSGLISTCNCENKSRCNDWL